MGKAIWHAKSSAKQFGGKAKDYLDIHTLIDYSRDSFPDLRHRALTHTSRFIGTILPLIFGETRRNSDGKEYSVRDIGEQHVLEDYDNQFIPSDQDFLAEMELQPWMDNARDGAVPPSRKKLAGEPKVPPAVQGKKIKLLPSLESSNKKLEKAFRQINRDTEKAFERRACANAGRGVID